MQVRQHPIILSTFVSSFSVNKLINICVTGGEKAVIKEFFPLLWALIENMETH